jgi:hypothetical protein
MPSPFKAIAPWNLLTSRMCKTDHTTDQNFHDSEKDALYNSHEPGDVNVWNR